MTPNSTDKKTSSIILPIVLIALIYSSIFILVLILKHEPSKSLEVLYGTTTAESYVTGRYQPKQHPDFINLSRLKIATGNPDQYMRKDAANALKNMLNAFKADHPKVKVWVESTTRSFWQQRFIWEAKWSGSKYVENKNLATEIKDPRKRAITILKYSAMPGTSRHHWGTEVDFNHLNNDYYDTGSGRILYQWLKQNALRFDFCQPYSANRSSGHSEERWHWSYRPLSKHILKDWNSIFWKSRQQVLALLDFSGAESSLGIAQAYANSINQQCK